MVVILASLYSILPPQTMRRVRAASIFLTLEHLNVSSKVDFFWQSFMINNGKLIGWLPSKKRQSAIMLCATGIRSQNVWMCRDAWARRSWAPILTICYVDLNCHVARASQRIQTFWDRIPVAQGMLKDCLYFEGNQPINFPLLIMKLGQKCLLLMKRSDVRELRRY
jgi:hypothetical protein